MGSDERLVRTGEVLDPADAGIAVSGTAKRRAA
jgi:hypothetical protein